MVRKKRTGFVASLISCLNPALSMQPSGGHSLLEEGQHAGRPLAFVEADEISQRTGNSGGDRAQQGIHINGEKKGRPEVQPITCHVGTERGNRFSSTLFLTLELVVLAGKRHAPAALSPGITPYRLYRKLGGPQGRSGRVRKISIPLRFDPRNVQSTETATTLSQNI